MSGFNLQLEGLKVWILEHSGDSFQGPESSRAAAARLAGEVAIPVLLIGVHELAREGVSVAPAAAQVRQRLEGPQQAAPLCIHPSQVAADVVPAVGCIDKVRRRCQLWKFWGQ